MATATATATTRKRKKKTDAPPEMLIEELVWLKPDELYTFPDNPRVGDKAELAKTLKANGYAKVLVVQKSTHYVLDGNHTHQCSRELGITKFPCVLVDVDDERAAKMVLAYNRLGDRGGYDPGRLAILAEHAGSAVGTGYAAVDFSILHDAANGSAVDMGMLQEVMRPPVELMTVGDTQVAVVTKPKRKKKKAEPEEQEPGEFEQADEELWGSITLKTREEFQFDTVGEWGFPRLHDDMLVTPKEIPKGLKAWAGSATKGYEDDDQWWLYTVGVDSTSGIRDLTKVIVGFYAYDHYFEGWWQKPERWVAKMINSGITMAITPDWSHWALRPAIEGFWNLYRARFIGRYMQDAGVKIIPNVAVMPPDYIDQYVRPTLPDKLPVISIQFQAIDRDSTPEDIALMKEYTKHTIEACDADLTLIYAGVTGDKVIREMVDEGLTNKLQIIQARRIALDAQALGRRKKTTL